MVGLLHIFFPLLITCSFKQQDVPCTLSILICVNSFPVDIGAPPVNSFVDVPFTLLLVCFLHQLRYTLFSADCQLINEGLCKELLSANG